MTAWQAPSTGATAAIAGRALAAVPELRTDRLRLRAPRIDDFPIYSRFSEAPETEAAWLDFCQIVASWSLRGFGPWTMEPGDGGAALGAIVLGHEYGDPEPEIGWVVAPDAEGRGYATEGARAALAHAFGPMGFATLVSYVDEDKPRSIAVAERLGGQRDPVAEQAIGQDCRVYRHLPHGGRA